MRLKAIRICVREKGIGSGGWMREMPETRPFCYTVLCFCCCCCVVYHCRLTMLFPPWLSGYQLVSVTAASRVYDSNYVIIQSMFVVMSVLVLVDVPLCTCMFV